MRAEEPADAPAEPRVADIAPADPVDLTDAADPGDPGDHDAADFDDAADPGDPGSGNPGSGNPDPDAVHPDAEEAGGPQPRRSPDGSDRDGSDRYDGGSHAEWQGIDEREDVPAAVRPYARTGGRTHPVRDLAVETVVLTSDRGRDTGSVRSVEHIAIAELCEHRHSVAEVSALLRLPLGVARVLLADMADAGLIEILTNRAGDSGVPDRALLERVIAGLRNL